jgi:hypothetical protein
MSSARSLAARALRGALVAVAVVALAATGSAQDPPSGGVEGAIDALDQALKNEPGLSDATKQALSNVVGMLKAERAESSKESKIEKMVDDYAKGASSAAKRKSFESVFDHLKIYGDFRFRAEGDVNRDGQPDRFRPRVRFRLGMDWWLLDGLTLNTRLVTGDPTDAQSPHQSLGTTFDKWDSNWDRLHLTYTPKCVDGLTLWLGKFSHPFYRNPVYGELVFDDDVGAEGIAGRYTPIKGDECSILEKVDLTLGAYDYIESNNFDDTFVLVAQAAASLKFDGCWSATGALGYYLWGGPVEAANAVLTGDNSGNATVDLSGDGTADMFVSDFEIINPIASVTYSRWEKWPITVAAEYIVNVEAENDRDQGWAAGASVGRTKSKGDWRFYYQYQEIEQDAVFSPVCQDDFILQTNFDGHVAGIQHMVTDEIMLQLWTLVSARDELGTSATTDSDQDQWRFRFDVNIRF